MPCHGAQTALQPALHIYFGYLGPCWSPPNPPAVALAGGTHSTYLGRYCRTLSGSAGVAARTSPLGAWAQGRQHINGTLCRGVYRTGRPFGCCVLLFALCHVVCLPPYFGYIVLFISSGSLYNMDIHAGCSDQHQLSVPYHNQVPKYLVS